MRIYEKVHLVVATPGRILDLMEKNVANVEKCKILVLDEADKLLSQDFKGMLDRVISHLPPNRQVIKSHMQVLCDLWVIFPCGIDE